MIHNIQEIRTAAGTEIADICEDLDAELGLYVEGEDLLDVTLGDVVYFYQIWTDREYEEVKNKVFSTLVRREGWDGEVRVYRARVSVFSCFDKEGIAYYIIDTWERALDLT